MVGVQNDTATMEISVEGPQKKLKFNLTQDSAKALLDIHPMDSASYFRDTDLSMFIAVLFIIARKWK